MFKKGQIIQYFKYELLGEKEKKNKQYQYIFLGEAFQTETEETLIIYQALYGQHQLFASPKSNFYQDVDKKKYPMIQQQTLFILADTIENKLEMYQNKIGNWVAFWSTNNKQIWHGRLEYVPSKGVERLHRIEVRKKNGERLTISAYKIIGFCSKPTKTNKNPEIKDENGNNISLSI